MRAPTCLWAVALLSALLIPAAGLPVNQTGGPFWSRGRHSKHGGASSEAPFSAPNGRVKSA